MTPPLRLDARCHCGEALTLYLGWDDYCVQCPRCFDPSAEDSGVHERLQGHGALPHHALEDWYRQRADLDLEPAYAPSELARFIVPAAPEGWGISPDGEQPARLFHESLSLAEQTWRGDAVLFYGPLVGQKAANDT